MKGYPILDERSFQNFIRTFQGDYFETLTNIDSVTRQAMISHTLLIDDDSWNVLLAKRAGYLAFQVPVTGLDFCHWNSFVQALENSN